MKKKNSVTFSGVDVDRDHGLAHGWATGMNGWKFEFRVCRGLIEINTREQTVYDAKADARQIRRELKKCFADIYNAKEDDDAQA